VEKWKDKVRAAINDVFRERIGTFDRLTYMMIKAHMENVINQVDVPNVQLIKYGKAMITESLMSFTELLEKIGGGKKNRNLNSISFNGGPSKHVTIADVIATIKSYRLEGKSFRDMEEIMGIPKTTLNSIYLKYEADEAEKIKEANRGYLDQVAHHEPS
jgi:extradiol dioxygenase family protein